MNKKKAAFLCGIEYIVLLLCLTMIFLFIVPQNDMFIFRKDTSPEWRLLIDFSLYYGNGRFLGNLLGVFFSHYFEFAWIVCTVCMFITIVCTNKLFFRNSAYTIFPSALVVVFASSGMFSECYTLFASFTNYFIPITVSLLSLCIYNRSKNAQKGFIGKIFLNILLFGLAASACLYSENTTIVLIALTVLLNLATVLKSKKVTLEGIVLLAGTAVGAATMFLIPVLTKTQGNLAFYRSVATSVSSIISNVPRSFVRFATVFNSFTLVLFCLSLILVVYTLKQEANSKVKSACIYFFLAYPFVSVLFKLFGYQSQLCGIMNVVEAVLAICYFSFWLLFVFFVMPKEKRWEAIGWTVLLLSSIAPMMLVNQYGHRTYLTTYFIMIGLISYLLKEQYFSGIAARFLNKKAFVVTSVMVFAFCCVFTSIQLLGNYNFDQERNEYVSEKVSEGCEEANVPVIPFVSVSIEDEWPNIVEQIALDQDIKVIVTDINSCENVKEYNEVIYGSFISNFKKAFTHKIQSMT